MDTNQQVHQPDGTPPLNSCFSEAAEHWAEKGGGPNEEAMATNQPEVSLAQSAKPGALVKTPSRKLANQFASFDAEQTKKKFADLSEAIRDKSEAFESAFKDAADRWDELAPCLSQMQSLLSQRGEQRKAVLQEAGLPSWTEWFERFKEELRWKISLRAVQKKLAALRERSDGRKDGKAEGPGTSAKPESERAPYKHGYQAGKAEVQAKLKAAAEKQTTLERRVTELEKENQKLQGIADGLQRQLQESGDKAVGKLPQHVERLKEFAKLAVEAFEIINGKYGERLMGNPEGKRLVELAKKAVPMKGKVKLC
jgi:hypothetical protein